MRRPRKIVGGKIIRNEGESDEEHLRWYSADAEPAMHTISLRLLIPDNSPLSLLATIGPEALDWLFVPGAEVWVTDMVQEEALRDPDPESDQRTAQRRDIAAWFERNRHRIHIQTTEAGEEYKNSMELWRLAGSPPDKKPSWKDRGEARILQVLGGVDRLLQQGEAVVTIVDDQKARAAIRVQNHDIDLMATESFITWMDERFHVHGADTAWQTIKTAMGARTPATLSPDEEPVSIFKV